MDYQSLVSFNYWTLIAQICNLFIQIYLFKRFLFKPVKDILAKRQAEIDGIYDDANKANNDAAAAKESYEKHLLTAHEEAEKITSSAIDSAKNRSEYMIHQAENEAARIREKASREIEMERKKAMDGMKNQISDIAIEIASAVVEKEIGASEHHALVEQFIEDLGDCV